MFHIWWYHHVARQPYNGKLKWLFNSRAGLGLGYCCTAITEKRISHRDQNSFLQQAVNVFISAVKLDCLLRTTKGSGVWFRQQMQGDSSCCTFSSTGLHLCRLKLLGVLILVVFSTFFTWRHGSVCDRARMRSAKRVLSFRQLVTVITN